MGAINEILRRNQRSIERTEDSAIKKRVKVRTGQLLNDRTYSTSGNVLTLTFPKHKRHRDIALRGNIHNKIVYFYMGRIAFEVMNDISDEVFEKFKQLEDI